MPNLDTRTTKTPAVDDYTYLLSNDGTVEGKVELQDVTVIPETTRTINFTSSQTATQIQAEIDSVGKYIPQGATITFQFGNGTYTLDNIIIFQGFYGGGSFFIYGDTTQTNALHTNHNVHLDFNNNSDGILIRGLGTAVSVVAHLRVTVDQGYTGIIYTRCPFYNLCRYHYITAGSSASSESRGIEVIESSAIYLISSYFSAGYYAIYTTVNSRVISNGNDDTGTQPLYGLTAFTNSTIGKNGTQPSGSTSNEIINTGGVIR